MTKERPGVRIAAPEHLAEFPPSDPEDLIFNAPKGAAEQLASISALAGCVAEAGLPENFRFHDLRQTGNTLAASSGASTRELMHRMGHPNCSKRALAGTEVGRPCWLAVSPRGYIGK
jgi:hypothetical protein